MWHLAKYHLISYLAFHCVNIHKKNTPKSHINYDIAQIASTIACQAYMVYDLPCLWPYAWY